MMEVLLITGFLGAGKTTLIQHLLRSEFNAQEKVAVIVNEVGEIGIDGTLLRVHLLHNQNRIFQSRSGDPPDI
jgi:G3E family GTPase